MQLKIIIVITLTSALASAYPTGGQFDQDAVANDGGGGLAFDGAPRFAGHTCDVCHTDPSHQITLRLEADDPSVFTGGYLAAHQYHMRVVMEGEHAGLAYAQNQDCGQIGDTPFQPCDDNGFALEIDDMHGAPAGTFAYFTTTCTATVPDDPDIHLLKNGAVTHEEHNGKTSWDLCWTAPAAGTGSLTAYLAGVDGNGGTGSAGFPNDTLNDDVAAGAVGISEAGSSGSQNVGGCNATGDAGLGLVVIALLARRYRKRVVAGALVLAAGSGCVHVRPRQRETLAHRNMTFAPDPAEDELDLHMQESREGSSGGYGSSGGGCGCN